MQKTYCHISIFLTSKVCPMLKNCDIYDHWEPITIVIFNESLQTFVYIVPVSQCILQKLTKSETRRLCVLANTKLYHQNLLLWISMKFWIFVSTTLGLFSKDPPIYPNTHIKLTKIKIRSSLGQFKTLLRITHLAHIGSHSWSLFAPIHMKSWPKVKLGQVQVSSNIAQNHSSRPYRKS